MGQLVDLTIYAGTAKRAHGHHSLGCKLTLWHAGQDVFEMEARKKATMRAACVSVKSR